jgi:hypothetical protein
LPTTDPDINTSAGARPNVDTTGDADPELISRSQQAGDTEIAERKQEADAAVGQDFGENDIFPNAEPLRVDPATEARVRGALEGVLIAEGSRDPSALLDAALTARLLERSQSPEDVARALGELPLSGERAGSQVAVKLRDDFFKDPNRNLDDLRKSVIEQQLESPESPTVRDRQAAIESLNKRVVLLQRVLIAAAKNGEFKTLFGLRKFLFKLAKEFVGK